ncbi:DUF4173 domain-containing protein [Bradyrhizobium ontarionense]|uniref:DUF4173 domain-containing protein n=1 Tax=Bradyrhizobium ontarionense TaxID=2898149 RepID=A0ABY3REM1_9BRAD|nr:DUF4173 domain-containing protein [Bradyrhizobium sp. A19]UFZ05836.1 DUF4173 domain-containing protein [Bradyrhizobium sp. A19]
MTGSAELTAAPAVSDSMWHKFAVAFGLLWLADILFYDQIPGLALPIFASVLVAASVLVNRARIDRRRSIPAAIILVAGLIPAIEDSNPLSFLIVVLTTISAVALSTDPAADGFRLPLTAARQLLLTGPFRLIPDIIAALRANDVTRVLLTWSIPLALGLVFILLFAAANPVIEQWLDQLQPQRVASNLSFGRPIFWLVILSLIWPFINLRWRQRNTTLSTPIDLVADRPPSVLASLLGPETVIRSLILFNVLFAVQTALDGEYLWGHAELPDGMTYAAYAHRGAYPLIVTALLAAAFVIIAVRSGTTEDRRFVRPLVYLWVAQNLMLVASSMQRVHIYVESYLLTGWRIAALIWMALVAAGLFLIVVRIVRNRPNGWLIRANLLVLAATLYGCALINFDVLIADYNVSHSREAGRQGSAIDINYLSNLSPQVLPAIERAILLSPAKSELAAARNRLLNEQAKNMASWRSWSFRGWRLQRYLDTHPLSHQPS